MVLSPDPVVLDWTCMERAAQKETDPSIHKYRVRYDNGANDQPQKVVLHLPCKCSPAEGKHLLTFTVPPKTKQVVVKWETSVCTLVFPPAGEAENEGDNAKAPTPSAPETSDAVPPPNAAPPPSPQKRASPEPGKPEPLKPENAEGRLALVPARLWPDYPCEERGGLGWEVRILSVEKKTATVEFLHARDERGNMYEDVSLPLHALKPLHADGRDGEEEAGRPAKGKSAKRQK
mmetsp:Transcript_48557/g.157388  ORF Transcript_48557/g.157388 Transcript_48557/m.157388 type:complete len:233 (+) Transcript_48557:91-789(+)